jgi:hypothetical protein
MDIFTQAVMQILDRLAEAESAVRQHEAMKSQLEAKVASLESLFGGEREALKRLVSVIELAGLANLAKGVPLGQSTWFVKASQAFRAAKKTLREVR